MHDIATRSPYTGLSTFFIDEHADEIALLTGRLSLTPLQAVFISLFYRWRAAPVDLSRLYDHTCTYYLRWNDSHFDAVDTLVALGYLDLTVIDRKDHYQLNPDALKSILRGEPYNPKQSHDNPEPDLQPGSVTHNTNKQCVLSMTTLWYTFGCNSFGSAEVMPSVDGTRLHISGKLMHVPENDKRGCIRNATPFKRFISRFIRPS